MSVKHIMRVDITGTMEHKKGTIHIARQLPGHYPLWRWKHYPLTPRNYWRAVGMQLCLAGFVDKVYSFEYDDFNPLDKKHYKEGE